MVASTGLARRSGKELGHTSGFLPSRTEAVRWGARRASATHKEAASLSNLLATRGELEPQIARGVPGGSSPWLSRAPEGGDTTQSGDPAPGPM